MAMMNLPPERPDDWEARERALVADQSFLVRAPAGSGKTDLLTRRILKLLAVVNEPEEILAITFTRPATAEMRARVLGDLERAAQGVVGDDAERDALAQVALKNSEARGWRLLEQPHRLNIETIDSLCLRVAQSQPLLSRLGGRLSPTEHSKPLYALAARRALGRMGSADPETDAALAHLLRLRDGRLQDCEELIADMLERRDQWVKVFPLSRDMSEVDWDKARSLLEKPFQEEIRRVHGEAHDLLTGEPLLGKELLELAQYACLNGNKKMGLFAGLRELPQKGRADTEHWRCIAWFLLTGDEWRKLKGLNIRHGFPTGDKGEKARMGKLLGQFQQIPGLRETLCAARDLPERRYEDAQWETLRHIFTVLRLAVAELRVLFAERNEVDFTELSLAARGVLSSTDVDTMLSFSGNVRHLLVDEFQDTSLGQHELLTLLVRAWEQGEGRTAFLVGDPMQSIYLFRQAEVELFDHVHRHGLGLGSNRVELEPLELRTNFRSHASLTEKWNEMFRAVFAAGAGPAHVAYSDTLASKSALSDKSVHLYPQILGSEAQKATPEERQNAREAEAEQVVRIIQRHLGRIEHAQRDGTEYRVAVLARNRSHLVSIAALLRENEIPFRAVDLEMLGERQELIDLMSLVRALLHPMDRVAWLSVLRAPWCGLMLADLHALTGADDETYKKAPVLELVEPRMAALSADGAARLRRTAEILRKALTVRYAMPFSQWIERTWRSLGGPQCVDDAGYENAQTFFTLLDRVTPGGVECLSEDFEAELSRLYVPPDPRVSERAGVQLMTIHKAKGLGFDVVIVPGLDRPARRDDPPLICSMQRTGTSGEPEILLAPIGHRGKNPHPTYAWVQRQRAERAEEELKRLFYVACTRAREELHLLGTVEIGESGLKVPQKGRLLATAWPALQAEFEERREKQGNKIIAFPKPAVLDMVAVEESSAVLTLHRLPVNFHPTPRGEDVKFAGRASGAGQPEFHRPEGSRDARHRGSVVHALLERASRGASLDALEAPARALLRSLAYSGKALEDMLHEVLAETANCLNSPDGAWILGAHAQAQSETSWTGWREGVLKTLRADRVFLAGAEPRAPGEDCLWIIDYKTSAPAGDADFFAHQRKVYTPQLESYAHALREAHGINLPVRYGLYYPRMAQLDWWSAE